MFIRSGQSAQTRRTRDAEERGDDGGASVDSGTQHHHRAGDVRIGRCDLPSGLGAKSRLQPLRLHLGCAEAGELDDITLARRLTDAILRTWLSGTGPSGGGSDPPLTLDYDARREHAYARGLADIERLADACRLGRWAEPAVGHIERLQLGDDRAGEQPAGSEVGARTAQERDSLGRVAEQLDRLHRDQAQPEVAAGELERTRVRAYRLDVEAHGSFAQSLEQGGVELERGHPSICL